MGSGSRWAGLRGSTARTAHSTSLTLKLTKVVLGVQLSQHQVTCGRGWATAAAASVGGNVWRVADGSWGGSRHAQQQGVPLRRTTRRLAP